MSFSIRYFKEIDKTQDEENDLLEQLLLESEKQEISEEEKTNVENLLIEFNKDPRINRK